MAGWRRRVFSHLPILAGAMAVASALTATALQAQTTAQPPAVRVVVTSKPIHALVAGVMQGVATPALLVDGTASPHSYAMKPSDAQKVHQADIFFRVSETLEPFTAKVMQSLPAGVERVTLAEAPGLRLLTRRSGGTFERHAHAAAGNGHVEHDHGATPAPGEGYDAHVWLDPANAGAMTQAIAAALARKLPGAADRFAGNAAAMIVRIDAMAGEIERDIAPVAERPFVVLHDAYQYFEARFGLNAVGSITLAPDVQPSARRLADLRAKVKSLAAVCVFAEPHLQQKVVSSVIEGSSARTGLLDPEGTTLDAGPELYFKLMRKLTVDIKACLSPTA